MRRWDMVQRESTSHRISLARGGSARRAVSAGLTAGAALFASACLVVAASAPSLGSAESFAVLGGTTVTNTGPTTITGDLGVSPGAAITGAETITLNGATHAADAVSLQAQNDVTTAYDVLAAEPCTQSFDGPAVEIGGQTLEPGVYCYTTSAQLTGTLTLNGSGAYVFKIASTLTTAAGSNVALIGGADACDVFWQVGSSADLFANTAFVGNILALTSINLQTGASVAGRVLARNGAVTLDTNTITNAGCVAGPTPTPSPAAPTATPSSGATAAPAPSLPPTDTVGAPAQGGSEPWLLVLLAAVIGSLALGFDYRVARSRAR